MWDKARLGICIQTHGTVKPMLLTDGDSLPTPTTTGQLPLPPDTKRSIECAHDAIRSGDSILLSSSFLSSILMPSSSWLKIVLINGIKAEAMVDKSSMDQCYVEYFWLLQKLLTRSQGWHHRYSGTEFKPCPLPSSFFKNIHFKWLAPLPTKHGQVSQSSLNTIVL